MKFEEFIRSLEEKTPPKEISSILLALWYEGKGRWSEAHEIIQDQQGIDAAWIHAYLHRKEGDNWNAGYWYRRAGKDSCSDSLEDEWTNLVRLFLKKLLAHK